MIRDCIYLAAAATRRFARFGLKNTADGAREEPKTWFSCDKYKNTEFYVTKNDIGAWLSYIDATDIEEFAAADTEKLWSEADEALPFHGGCTFCGWTDRVGTTRLSEKRLLLGCDWCHGFSSEFAKPRIKAKRPSYREMYGVEDATLAEVVENVKAAIDALPKMRLTMAISGDFAAGHGK